MVSLRIYIRAETINISIGDRPPTRVVDSVLLHPLVAAVSTLGEYVGNIARTTQPDLEILKEVVVVGSPSVFPVQSSVGSLSLRIGVGRGRNGAVRNTAILDAERLDFATNVFHSAGRGERHEAT